MKKALFISCILCMIFVLSTESFGGHKRWGRRGRRHGPGGGLLGGITCMLEEYDLDEDGVLSREERKAAREAIHAAILAEFDVDEDGELSEEERDAARAARIAPYDLDEDGKLNEEERAAMRADRCQEEEEVIVEELIGNRHRRRGIPCIFMEYDTNEDGRLSREEMMEARTARKAAILEEFDVDDDGELSEEEKAAARAARRERILEEHDTDGDGELSREERQAARESRCQGEEDVIVAEMIGEPKFRRADTNEDGTVNLADVVDTLGHLFKGKGKLRCLSAADANDDGAVDLSDPIAILDNLFNQGPPCPFPAEELGIDPTPDSLECEE